MLGLGLIVLGAVVTIPATTVSLAIFRARQAVRRNDEDRCARCDGPLYAPGAWAGPSLVQGDMICEPCAAIERRRLPRSLIAAATITSVTVVGLAAVAIWAPLELGSHPWVPVIATVVSYPAIFGAAIAWMKRANRRAAHHLGLQPDVSLGAARISVLKP